MHTHLVKENPSGGSLVEDTIEFEARPDLLRGKLYHLPHLPRMPSKDVTSEPVVNNITWFVLDFLLRGRCRNLNGSYGGEILN